MVDEGRELQTMLLSGSVEDMQLALERLEQSVAPQLYAEALAALTLALELAEIRHDSSVSITLHERHAAPAMAWLSREADRLHQGGDATRAEALLRVVRSGLEAV